MYLLPVTTYSDYVKASSKWTAWAGGTLLMSFMLGSPQVQGLKASQFSFASRLEVKVDGIAKVLNTKQSNPYEIIRSAGVNLGPNDIVSVEGKTIKVTRAEERLIQVDSEVQFTTERRVDYKLDPEASVVISQGHNGLKREVIKLTLVGGKEVGRETVSTHVIIEPVKQIIAYNPKSKTVTKQGLPDNVWINREMIVEATAYTFTGNNTATGVAPRVGLVAVDPKVIPLGTKLYIEGYGMALAADTGGAIKGMKVDVFFNTLKECLNWGRRKVKIYVLAS